MDPFPYVMGALVAVGLSTLFFGIWRAVDFGTEIRGHVGHLTHRVSVAEASQALAEKALRDLQAVCERQDKALERQANELRDHRLSLPPPSVRPPTPVPSSGVQTSADWDDGEGRRTLARPSSPPPLPAFERPAYMSRG